MRDWVLTLAVWLLFFWLVSDVFVFAWHFLLWLLGEEPQPAQLARAIALIGTLGSYLGVIATNAALLLGWAYYNQRRFRAHERRKFAPLVSCEDLSQMYGFPVSVIEEWQAATILVAHLAEDGGLTSMEVRQRPSLESVPTGNEDQPAEPS